VIKYCFFYFNLLPLVLQYEAQNNVTETIYIFNHNFLFGRKEEEVVEK